MPNTDIRKMVDAAYNSDVPSFKTEFNNSMVNKVSDALASKKVEVAGTFINDFVKTEESK